VRQILVAYSEMRRTSPMVVAQYVSPPKRLSGMVKHTLLPATIKGLVASEGLLAATNPLIVC
jgi:hypothetical protein